MHPSPPAAVFLNDLYRFSAAANAWTALSPSGSVPSPRANMGFAVTPDGILYIFGGWDTGNEGVGEGGSGQLCMLRGTPSGGVHAPAVSLWRRGRGWGGRRYVAVCVHMQRRRGPYQSAA